MRIQTITDSSKYKLESTVNDILNKYKKKIY